jgi:hypothetical protein
MPPLTAQQPAEPTCECVSSLVLARAAVLRAAVVPQRDLLGHAVAPPPSTRSSRLAHEHFGRSARCFGSISTKGVGGYERAAAGLRGSVAAGLRGSSRMSLLLQTPAGMHAGGSSALGVKALSGGAFGWPVWGQSWVLDRRVDFTLECAWRVKRLPARRLQPSAPSALHHVIWRSAAVQLCGPLLALRPLFTLCVACMFTPRQDGSTSHLHVPLINL